MKQVTNLNERTSYYGSDDLVNELKSKMKEGDTVVNFAFTDYGGDFFDKVCIQYFTEKYPNSIVKENTSYSGENAFLFGEVANEFFEATEDYLLGFEDLEEYYSNMEYEEEVKGFGYFLESISKYNGYEIKENALDTLLEEKAGHYNVLTTGLDYSESDLIAYCEENNLISKETED